MRKKLVNLTKGQTREKIIRKFGASRQYETVDRNPDINNQIKY